jgi:hypothetical protein
MNVTGLPLPGLLRVELKFHTDSVRQIISTSCHVLSYPERVLKHSLNSTTG